MDDALQVQVVSKQNIYLYEFGQKMISHPRGVAVDCHGNILVLESKVNRILVFSSTGKLRKKFYLSQADFPNSIAVNKFQEVYVADNKRHCVHVSSYRIHLEVHNKNYKNGQTMLGVRLQWGVFAASWRPRNH